MEFTRCIIEDVVIVDPAVHGDERGYFVETYRGDKLEAFLGYAVDFCQDNESKSSRGVLRGLHYQLPPFAQSKLVRAVKGAVLDVAVDIRSGSPTFGKHVVVMLSEQNKRQLFIPRGFAHAFLVLEDETVFAYKTDNYYAPQSDRGIAYDDPTFDIDWGMAADELILSDKDRSQPLLEDAEIFETMEGLYD